MIRSKRDRKSKGVYILTHDTASAVEDGGQNGDKEKTVLVLSSGFSGVLRLDGPAPQVHRWHDLVVNCVARCESANAVAVANTYNNNNAAMMARASKHPTGARADVRVTAADKRRVGVPCVMAGAVAPRYDKTCFNN